jgi:hypothetical protein
MGEAEFEKNVAENLIKAVQETYANLRKQYPDKDEHWYLANVWLKRCGSGEEAKEKGKEWAQFTAYKETHEFAILDSPKAIRGLALLMVAQELGEAAAKQYESEFFKIIEPVVKVKQDRAFLKIYQEKNPLTWAEIEQRDDSTFSLYWLFRGIELAQEQEGEPLDEWGEVDFLDQLEKQEETSAEEQQQEEELPPEV